MKKIVALILSVMMLVCISVSAMADTGYDLNEAKKSVVRILTEYTVIDPRAADYGTTYQATGSGFCIGLLDDSSVEYVVTAAHVVGYDIDSGTMSTPTTLTTLTDGSLGYVEIRVDGIYVLLGDIENRVKAQLVSVMPTADVAVIRMNTAINVRRPAVLLNKTEFEINEQLTTMGFPAATEHNLTMDAIRDLMSDTSHVSVNQGTFSVIDTHTSTQQGDQITTNAMMSNGISGGPLLDADGYVVGVCIGGSARNQNANYAVTTGEVLRLLGSLNELNGKYEVGPLKDKGLSTTMIIIIVAAAVIIIALILLIILSSRGKKNARSLTFGGTMGGKVVQLKKGSPVVIGRDPARCQVVYAKDTSGVSSVHCTITFDGNEVLVADNGSSYGTFVGGQKVEPGKPVVMHRGQEVTFGSNKNSAELH